MSGNAARMRKMSDYYGHVVEKSDARDHLGSLGVGGG
jgi:hypothetical protein